MRGAGPLSSPSPSRRKSVWSEGGARRYAVHANAPPQSAALVANAPKLVIMVPVGHGWQSGRGVVELPPGLQEKLSHWLQPTPPLPGEHTVSGGLQCVRLIKGVSVE